MQETDLFEYYDLEEDWESIESEEQCAFIAAVIRQKENEEESQESLDELERLADTAGIAILGRYTQRRTLPDTSTYFGKGFLEELAHKLFGAKADYLIINDELSPVQARNIEKNFAIKVIDRTELILSIFHRHAKTKEAKLQVKLAELEYQLPRLKKLWGHFDKERGSGRAGGGGMATRGMGEKQIEIDKRLIRTQIRKINDAIDSISRHKETQRKQREQSLKLCLVGYTNAGKSTLFNRLTDAGVLVEDMLFATLDSTSRQLKLSTGAPVVISDTVGFISKLPHHLVASFRATLMEVVDADLLLHVVDISDPRHDYYIEQVSAVLQSIGASEIPQILVLNKSDLIDERLVKLLTLHHEGAVAISAADGSNIPLLLSEVETRLLNNQRLSLMLPYEHTAMVSRLHELGKILSEDYREDGIHLVVNLPAKERHIIERYIVESEKD